MFDALMLFAQDQSHQGPMGPEFGKAAPMGLFIVVILLLVVLLLGFSMNKRIRRMERRRAFAEQYGIDLFDAAALEAKMREVGFEETRGGKGAKGVMYARTEVADLGDRFTPASGTLKGPAAIDAERAAAQKQSSEHEEQ